jgi:hypothetical protein
MMPVDDTIEVGEATLAVVGLSTVLKGDMPRMGVAKQKEVIDLNKKIDALAADFVYDRLPRKLSMPRPFTYRQLLDKFTKPIPESEVTAIVAKFPPDAHDAALSFLSTLTQAYKHVADMLPVANYDTYLGPKRIMPTSDKTTEFFLKLWVIDDPLICFQLMQSGAIQVEQVQAVAEFFPSLYNYMKAAILDALISRNHREASFMDLPPRADRGLATFKQQRIVPYGVNIHELSPDKGGAPQPLPPKGKPPAGLETQAQKAGNL